MANDVDKTEHIKHSLELQEDIPLFKRGIHFQRAGIVLMFIFLICGAAGAFGTGPISQQHLTVGTAQIESEKFLRFKDETELIFRIQQVEAEAEISFPAEYLEHFEVKNIMPEPVATEIVADKVVYRFAANQKAVIRFFLSPGQTGSVDGILSVNNEPVSISHFIYR